MTKNEFSCTAVVVSYNRKDLLQETLAALRAQTRPLDRLIVVDNASTDGAAAVAAKLLESWGKQARLITLQENTGGAGGFAVGIAAALVPDAAGHVSDWIWVMDDNTVPSATALATALDAHQAYVQKHPDTLAVLGSKVVWTNGQTHPMNTPKQKLFATGHEKTNAAGVGAMPIRSISFVSAFLRTARVAETGLPLADYFLWNDDFEYSARLLNGATGLYVPASVVTHKTKQLGGSDSDPGARFFYEVRNKLWVFKHSRALKFWEKCAYIAATARRWTRTFKHSADRKTLSDCLRRGFKAGLTSRPRPAGQVLQGAGVPADVAAVIAGFNKPGQS